MQLLSLTTLLFTFDKISCNSKEQYNYFYGQVQDSLYHIPNIDYNGTKTTYDVVMEEKLFDFLKFQLDFQLLGIVRCKIYPNPSEDECNGIMNKYAKCTIKCLKEVFQNPSECIANCKTREVKEIEAESEKIALN